MNDDPIRIGLRVDDELVAERRRRREAERHAAMLLAAGDNLAATLRLSRTALRGWATFSTLNAITAIFVVWVPMPRLFQVVTTVGLVLFIAAVLWLRASLRADDEETQPEAAGEAVRE